MLELTCSSLKLYLLISYYRHIDDSKYIDEKLTGVISMEAEGEGEAPSTAKLLQCEALVLREKEIW